jgi:GT2 family glycosyltransferase
LQSSRHEVTTLITGVENGGKFDNVNALLASAGGDYDWVFVVDDDVVLPRHFLDRFISIAEHFDLRVAQPAHRFTSFHSWPVTTRNALTIARVTTFVEIGPITAFHRSTLQTFMPFSAPGMGYGLDFEWARTAFERGWRIGIVDWTPIVHLSPPGASYQEEAQRAGNLGRLSAQPRTLHSLKSW